MNEEENDEWKHFDLELGWMCASRRERIEKLRDDVTNAY
jgi:hypothetical protein